MPVIWRGVNKQYQGHGRLLTRLDAGQSRTDMWGVGGKGGGLEQNDGVVSQS